MIQGEYEMKLADDIKAAVLDKFGSFIEKAWKAKLDQHLGYSRYDFQNKATIVN